MQGGREGGRCTPVWTRQACSLMPALCRCRLTSWKEASDSELGAAGNNQRWQLELNTISHASPSWPLCTHNTLSVSSGPSPAIWSWTFQATMCFSLKSLSGYEKEKHIVCLIQYTGTTSTLSWLGKNPKAVLHRKTLTPNRLNQHCRFNHIGTSCHQETFKKAWNRCCQFTLLTPPNSSACVAALRKLYAFHTLVRKVLSHFYTSKKKAVKLAFIEVRIQQRALYKVACWYLQPPSCLYVLQLSLVSYPAQWTAQQIKSAAWGNSLRN